MTTLSSNIAGVLKPMGLISRYGPGDVVDVDRLKKKKKKKKQVGVYEMVDVGDGYMLMEKVEKKYKVNGKTGVWRTIQGRHYFFPDDGSGSIPPMKFKK